MQNRDKSQTSRRAILTGLGSGGFLAALPGCQISGKGPERTPLLSDLSSGLAAEREYFLSEPSTIAGFTDAASLRLWDDRGRFAFTRISIDATSPSNVNQMQMTLVFADGRVLRNFEPGSPHSVRGSDGLPRILGAGPLRFECIEPFRHHRVTFSGTALDTSYQALIEGNGGDRRIELEFEIDCVAVAPTWNLSSNVLDTETTENGKATAKIMGGARFEQLMRATGRMKIDGIEHSFGGGALRSRRQGIRDSGVAGAYAWQSAIFPSGRGFGYLAYLLPDGVTMGFNQGYILRGNGKIIPARATAPPQWLKRMEFDSGDAGLTLESELGRTRIDGKLVMGAPILPKGSGLAQLQSIAQFRWGDETAYGLTDRATVATKLHLPR